VGPARGDDLRVAFLSSRPDPADPVQLARLLARHGVRPRQRLGQNFLVDRTLRDRIVEETQVQPADQVLEIGAGPGTLTLPLARRCRRLIAVELDERLLRVLRQVVGGFETVEILAADVLRIDRGALFPNGGEIVVGNIPYYVTGALLPKLLEQPPRPRRLAFVVQKEVAQRWVANSGWSLATVAIRVFAEPELVMLLPASAFQPRPRVDSALVRLTVRATPAVDVDDLHAFFAFVEQVFQFRRKQLRASLGRLVTGGGAEAAARLESAGIDATRRPETLTLEEWQRLYETFAVGTP
jgi:16S rRNA (adenine1518-N6/adenine1519-N6)-dimethyltransferase